MWRLPVLLVMALGPEIVLLQLGPQQTTNTQYVLDKDCNSETAFNIYDKEAVVKGHSSTEVQNTPESCTLMLATENNFEKAIFRIIVRSATINSVGVRLAIYDGTPGQRTLASYDSVSGKGPSELRTTGNKVTFVLTRRYQGDLNFDLEFLVTPIIAGTNPGPENGWGGDYGYFNRTVPNMVIYIIVGVLFLIVIIVIIVVAIVCHRKQKGLNKKPEEYKISYISPAMHSGVGGGRGGGIEASTRRWVSTSRSSLHRQRNHNYGDDDSVFDASVDSFPSKKRYEEDDYSYDRRKQRYEQREDPPSYRNSSYVQADDDRPSSNYTEREITPRVQSAHNYKAKEELEDDITDMEEEDEEEEDESVEDEAETEEEEEGRMEEDEDDGVPNKPPPVVSHLSEPPHPTARTQNPPPTHPYHGYPLQTRAPAPYAVYPGPPQHQFIPIVPGPQFQPVQGPAVNMPAPPRYQMKSQPKNSVKLKANDPPIYSYLVQRGYNPVDGRDSPVSVSTNASAGSNSHLLRQDESDLSAHNLGAGVEYMRR